MIVRMHRFGAPLASAALLLSLVACNKDQNRSQGGSEGRAAEPASDAVIAIDGSSTVHPISEAVAEEFRATSPDTRVTIGVSGTGGGFTKFCHGEIAIAGASRPIKPTELAECTTR